MNEKHVKEVLGTNGDVLGHEIYDGENNLLEFVPFVPEPRSWTPEETNRSGLPQFNAVHTPSDDKETERVEPADTCCGCGGCFR